VKSHLVVIDTGGLSVDCAVPAGLFGDPDVPEAIKESGVEEKMKYKVLIIPEMARDVQREIHEAMPGWEVILGPREPSQLGVFLDEEWKKILEGKSDRKLKV
jgi:acetyl-CoA decarbonylase/synthase complex subunit gamma